MVDKGGSKTIVSDHGGSSSYEKRRTLLKDRGTSCVSALLQIWGRKATFYTLLGAQLGTCLDELAWLAWLPREMISH